MNQLPTVVTTPNDETAQKLEAENEAALVGASDDSEYCDFDGNDEDEEGRSFDEEGEEVWVEEPEEDDTPSAPKRRPTPPKGFVLFTWKTKKHESGMSVRICPECGATGSTWMGGGYTDPKAQALADAFESSEDCALHNFDGWTNPELGIDGECLRDHWSRYGRGTCMGCGLEFWHDFVGNCSKKSEMWAYYYKPTKGQLGLF